MENTSVGTQLEKSIIRVVEHDGFGGSEFVYHCCQCKNEVKTSDKFCSNCGEQLLTLIKKDTWGL